MKTKLKMPVMYVIRILTAKEVNAFATKTNAYCLPSIVEIVMKYAKETLTVAFAQHSLLMQVLPAKNIKIA